MATINGVTNCLYSCASSKYAETNSRCLSAWRSGGLITKTHRQAFGQLAEDGFDVYLYDQVGGGFSERLTEVRQYTVARQVADLEAIRQQLNAEQMILIGHSWEGELAAHYLATYPNRVAKVVFSSPVGLWSPAFTETNYVVDPLPPDQEARAERFMLRYYLSPRYLTFVSLLWLNPEAAHNFAGDREMDSWNEAYFKLIARGLCDSKKSVQITTNTDAAHGGFYAYSIIWEDTERFKDIRPALTKNQTPALILRGECDFLVWEHVEQYKQTLPNATLLYLEDAGYSIYAEKPKLYLAAVRAFLLKQPLPLSPYTKSD